MKLHESAKQIITENQKTVSMDHLASEYDKKYNQMKRGEISDQEWYDYCTNLLGDILDDNKDVMIRLKQR